MLGMFCHNKSVFKKDVLLLLLSKLIDSGERAVVLCWTQWVGAAALSSSAHWGRPTLPLCAGHSADNSWATMVWFVISPLYTYILFQNACEDNVLHVYVCMSVMYAFVFTCAWAHMWGVHMECMFWVWRTLRRSKSYVFFSLSPFPTLRQGLSLTETGMLAVKAMGLQ